MTVNNSLHNFWQKNRGILFIASGQAFLAGASAIVKTLQIIDPTSSPLQCVLVRMGTIYVFSIGCMLFKKVPHPWLGPPDVRYLLCFRGICGFLGLMGLYTSLNFLSLSDSTSLSFLGPIATGILSAVFLGEVFGRRQALAAIFSLCGVILIARPSFLFDHTPARTIVNLLGVFKLSSTGGKLLGLGGSMVDVWLGTAASYTCVRGIGERGHALHSMAAFSGYSTVLSIVAMIVTGTPFAIPLRFDCIALYMALGIFGCISQTVITTGLRIGPAGRNCIGIYTQIIFASILQHILFNSDMTFSSAVGTVIILTSAAWIAFSQNDKAKSPVAESDAESAIISSSNAEREPLITAAIDIPTSYDATTFTRKRMA